jgi:hypothetical protein
VEVEVEVDKGRISGIPLDKYISNEKNGTRIVVVENPLEAI